MSYDGFEKTLGGRSCRLSRPTDLNDPLDMFLQDALGMDELQFLHELRLTLLDFLSGELDYARLRNSEDKFKVIAINQMLRQAAPDVKNAIRKEVLETSLEEMYDLAGLRRHTREALEQITKIFENDGVFCSTIDSNNLLMWAHYADQHRGVVLEFTPSVEKDSVFLASREVRYTNVRPVLYKDPIAMITHSMVMEEKEVAESIYDNLVYTKSTEWSYEKEYRLHIPNSIPSGGGFSTMQFYDQELTAIYVGCRMDVPERSRVVALAKEINASTSIWEARIVAREFRLEYVKMGDG